MSQRIPKLCRMERRSGRLNSGGMKRRKKGLMLRQRLARNRTISLMRPGSEDL